MNPSASATSPYAWLLANWGLSLASTCSLVEPENRQTASDCDSREAGRPAAEASGDA